MIGWTVVSISLLLLISADGLSLFAQQGLGRDNAATLLFALHLASWSYVLGLVGLLLGLAWWFVSRRRMQLTRGAVSGYAPVEPSFLRVEDPERETTTFQEYDDMAPAVPDLLFGQSDDRTKATRSTKVA